MVCCDGGARVVGDELHKVVTRGLPPTRGPLSWCLRVRNQAVQRREK